MATDVQTQAAPIKRPSMRGAINAMCKTCIYDPKAAGCGTWRQQVEACTSPNCPLFPLRPTSKGEKGIDQQGGD